MSTVLTHPRFGTCVEASEIYTNDRNVTYVGGNWFAEGYGFSTYANLPADEVSALYRQCYDGEHNFKHVWGNDWQCIQCGLREGVTPSDWEPEPEGYPTDALDYDTVENLGLDGTGRDRHPHFPYRWSDPVVQAYVAQWIDDHQ